MTKELTELQAATLEAIKGRISGMKITGKELASAIGLKPRSPGKEGADMRRIIHALRVKGFPICASTEGYWWPISKEELQGYIESFQGRVDDQQAAVDGMRLGGKEFDIGRWAPGKYIVEEDGGMKTYNVSAERMEVFKNKFPEAKRI